MLSMGYRLGFQEFEKPENVSLGDGRVLKALGSGSVRRNMLFQLNPRKQFCMMCCTCLNSLQPVFCKRGSR